jgi:hypothetical protein
VGEGADGAEGAEQERGDKPNPEATGVRTSLGGAKTACELFVKRSGHV